MVWKKLQLLNICVDDFVQKSLVLHCSHSAGRHCYCCLAEQLDVCWNDAFPHFLFQLLGEAAQFLPPKQHWHFGALLARPRDSLSSSTPALQHGLRARPVMLWRRCFHCIDPILHISWILRYRPASQSWDISFVLQRVVSLKALIILGSLPANITKYHPSPLCFHLPMKLRN